MRKDEGAWSIPKGEIDAGEDPEQAARREFLEETGVALEGALLALGEFRQPGGKRVLAFALEGACDASRVRSNPCRIEWPPGTGRTIVVPEVDRAAWFPLAEAASKIHKGQRGALEALARRLG